MRPKPRLTLVIDASALDFKRWGGSLSYMSLITDPDPSNSIAQCYEIIPPEEAWEIWFTCPLPDRSPRQKTDNDDPDIYIA